MSEQWTIENIDFFEVARDGDQVSIRFMDLFDQGEEYLLSVDDASWLRDALTKVIDTG